MVSSRKTSLRHRLSIGTIVGDTVLNVRFKSGGFLGTIEESFISSLNIGDIFWLVSLDLSTKTLFNTVRQLVVFDTIMKVPPSNREKRMIRFSIDPYQFTLDGPNFYETLSENSQQLILKYLFHFKTEAKLQKN